MSSDNPYGPTQPGPWGQGGPASGPSGPPPYGYPPQSGGPPAVRRSRLGLRVRPVRSAAWTRPRTDGPRSGEPLRRRPAAGKGRSSSPVVALVVILIGVGAAVLVRNRGAADAGADHGPDLRAAGPSPRSPAPRRRPPALALQQAAAGYLKAVAAGDADAALAYAADAGPGREVHDQPGARRVGRSGRRSPRSASRRSGTPTASQFSASYPRGQDPGDGGLRSAGGSATCGS